MLKKYLVLSFYLFLGIKSLLSQQTFPMKDTTVAECEGIHTDSDLKIFPAGQYLANEDYTFSICPGSGATIYYTFSSFFTEVGIDTVTFYDGPNILSPRIATYSGNLNASLPPTIIANSGCLTITFKSDGVLEFPGWIATWFSDAPPITSPTMNVSNLAPPACDSTSFLVEFDRNLHCDSIVSAASNLLGYNAPNIVNITRVGCINDSSRFARIWLDNPFVFNCEYQLEMEINIPDICDSVYSFLLLDTFDFTSCNLLANLTTTNDSLCFGDCASLEMLTSSSCNTYTYNWSNGLPATAGPHSVCPTSTTTYSVVVTEANSGKTYLDSVTIKVLDTFEKDIAISVNSSEPPQCNDRFFIVKLSKPLRCDLLDSATFNLTSSAGSFSITNVYPLSCTNNFLDSVRLRINPRFTRNCDYILNFNLNFVDSCEGLISIQSSDTFQITDCPFSLRTVYSDSLCAGNCTNVRAIASGCSGYNYVWSNGLPNSAGPFSICPTRDTTFYVTVTELSSSLILIDTIDIKIIDPTINPVSPKCSYDSAFNLITNTPGGIWSGTGITDPILGTFDPAIAMAGSHLITYQLNTCQDTIVLVVTATDAGADQNLCASGIPVNLTNGNPSGGTWTGTGINSISSTFTPSTFGNFLAYYTVNGCIDSMLINVDTIALTYFTDTLCSNNASVNIPFSPVGGTWSGTGIISPSLGTFSPSSANNGSNLVSYFYRGCRDTVNMVVTTVNAGQDTNSCPSQPAFTLPSGSPALGVWSGTGVSSAGLFNPATLTSNWNSDLVYTISGCSDTIRMEVIQTNVIPDTVYLCPSSDSVLINSIPGLTKEPNYGTWSGTGTQTFGIFQYIYPRIMGTGFHLLFYDKNTCQDSVVFAIYPDTLSISDTIVCNTQTAFMLDPTNNMNGAVWQGPGITNNQTGMFDPNVAGVGSHIITYRTQGNICNKTISVTVYQFVAARITLPDTFCFVTNSISIPAVPAGGIWSGTGNYNQTTGTFNPAIAGPGLHQIYYSFGSGVCLTNNEKYVFVRDSIVADLQNSADTICLGESVNLNGSATGGNPSPTYTYSWSHNSSTSGNLTETPSTTTQYILTVNDGCSNPDSDTSTVSVLSIVPSLTTNPIACFGELGFATYDLSQKSIFTFNWTQPLSMGDTIIGIVSDSVFLSVTNDFGCSIDTFMVLPGYEFMQANFSMNPDTYPKCLSSENKILTVTDASIGATQGFWDFGDGSPPLPYSTINNNETYTYENGGNYTITLIVKNNGPCFDTLTRDLCVSEIPFFIADIFSPNGDGVNDFLYVRSSEAEKLEFLVYDRWGNLLFESDDVSKGWDGTFKGRKAEEGVYFFSVKMTLISGEEILKKGDITLIR